MDHATVSLTLVLSWCSTITVPPIISIHLVVFKLLRQMLVVDVEEVQSFVELVQHVLFQEVIIFVLAVLPTLDLMLLMVLLLVLKKHAQIQMVQEQLQIVVLELLVLTEVLTMVTK